MKDILLPTSQSVQPTLTTSKINNKIINTKKIYMSEEMLALKKQTKNQRELRLRNVSLKTKKTISVGAFCDLKVTAVGPKNVGIDEFSYGFSILIPKAQLGETGKAQIKRIFNFKKAKYGVASFVQPTKVLSSVKNIQKGLPHLTVGEILTVKVDHITIRTDNSFICLANSIPFPLGPSSKGSVVSTPIIIPLGSNKVANSGLGAEPKIGQEIQVRITKIKSKYAFAQALLGEESSISVSFPNHQTNNKQLAKGSKITLTLPKTAKKYAKHMVLLLKEKPRFSSDSFPFGSSTVPKGTRGSSSLDKKEKEEPSGVNTSSPFKGSEAKPYVVFLKNLLGAKFGDKVRVKFTKVGLTFAIGQILRISPTSPLKKLARARKNLKEMLTNGMHYGEKVVKCQAKMRGYVWNRKKVTRLFLLEKNGIPPIQKEKGRVAYSNVGQGKPSFLSFPKGTGRTGSSKREEKNSAVIKKGRHLINLLKTRRCLNIGLNQLTKYAAKGRTFLFVGTKKPAAGLIARAALFSKTSFFVNTRWLGGMLTNWKTIVKSISKIRPILKEKQLVISNILQKRAVIQNRLIKKVLSLRKKSKALIKKGKQLITKVKNSAIQTPNQKSEAVLERTGILMKRKALFERGQFLLLKRQSLLTKQNELKEKTLQIKENGFLIANKYNVLLNKLTAAHKKLHDIRLIFILNKELRSITKLAKEQGKNQYTLSYEKFKQFSSLGLEKEQSPFLGNILIKMSSKKLWLIPNPPQEILNKILITISGLSSNNWSLKTENSVGISLPFKESEGTQGKNSGSLLRSKNDSLMTKGILSVPSINNKNRDKKTLSLANFSVKEKNNTSLSIPNFNKTKAESEELFTSDSSPFEEGTVKKSIVLTRLLSKFSRFLPYIKNAVNSMLRLMLGMEKKMTELKTHLKNLKIKLTSFLLFNKKINVELKLIQTKYTSEQQIIRILRRKLKRYEAEKKLLQFLPKLRYLPTPKSQIALAIQILMKRFVDPKMKYPMDLIYDEKLRKKSKKVAAARKKQWQRLEAYFGGIANMTKLNKTQISNNVAIIIGQQEEMNAVLECKKLGIKMFHIVDTNCNPSLADHFIPSNDDSRNSIKYLLTKIVTRIRLAQKIRLRFKS